MLILAILLSVAALLTAGISAYYTRKMTRLCRDAFTRTHVVLPPEGR